MIDIAVQFLSNSHKRSKDKKSNSLSFTFLFNLRIENCASHQHLSSSCQSTVFSYSGPENRNNQLYKKYNNEKNFLSRLIFRGHDTHQALWWRPGGNLVEYMWFFVDHGSEQGGSIFFPRRRSWRARSVKIFDLWPLTLMGQISQAQNAILEITFLSASLLLIKLYQVLTVMWCGDSWTEMSCTVM